MLQYVLHSCEPSCLVIRATQAMNSIYFLIFGNLCIPRWYTHIKNTYANFSALGLKFPNLNFDDCKSIHAFIPDKLLAKHTAANQYKSIMYAILHPIHTL